MLALTRKAGEKVRIGDAVVTIVWVRGKQVRLSIEAPKHVKVLRTELE